MFQTIKCSSSGRLYKQLYGILSSIYISSLVTIRMCLILDTYFIHTHISDISQWALFW